MKTYKFYRENNRWYIDLPTYPGSKAELEMVQGADDFLNILAQDENEVYLTVSLKPFFNCDQLVKINNTPEVGGAVYFLKKYKFVEYNLRMWLCGVTEFVFGNLPEVIYFK